MTAVEAANFVFVHATGADSAGTIQENRRKIRQQARKYIGNEWKSARLQSLDIRQVVTSQIRSQPGPSVSRKSRKKALHESAEDQRDGKAGPTHTPAKVPATVPADDYAAARIRYNFDLSWLSALTISHVGSMRMDESLGAWIRYRERTFLDLVPGLYARSHLVRCVVDSILAKAAYTLQPGQKTHKLSLCTYGAALKGVQAALVYQGSAASTDMLCAIRLLQIYELLDVTVPDVRPAESLPLRENKEAQLSHTTADVKKETLTGWSITGTQNIGSHAQGMQSLVVMRGPSSFRTEMEKLLLCSLLENFWLQAYLSNADCFFECQNWQTYLHSVTNSKDATRHPVTLLLWTTLAKLPRLLRQANDILQTEDYQHRSRQGVQMELSELRTKLTKWNDSYERTEVQLNFSAAFYQELLGFGLGTLAIVCRVLLALDPAADDALGLEAEAQMLSQRTFALLIEHIVSSGFFVGVCNWATAAEWQVAIRNAQAIRKQTGELGLLDYEVFAKWNGMMGRKPHSERMGTPWRKEVDDAIKQFLTGATVRATAKQPSYTGIVWYL